MLLLYFYHRQFTMMEEFTPLFSLYFLPCPYPEPQSKFAFLIAQTILPFSLYHPVPPNAPYNLLLLCSTEKKTASLFLQNSFNNVVFPTRLRPHKTNMWKRSCFAFAFSIGFNTLSLNSSASTEPKYQVQTAIKVLSSFLLHSEMMVYLVVYDEERTTMCWEKR